MLVLVSLCAAADLAAVLGELRTLTDADYTRRAVLLSEVPAGPLMRALVEATPEALHGLAVPVDPDGVVARLASEGVPVNRYLEALEVLPRPVRDALRPVQPAVVRVVSGKFGGTGVNLAARGLVLTADHVITELPVSVEFPDGSRFVGTIERRDHLRDLALVRLAGAVALPRAELAPEPPEVGESIVIIGHPGSRTRAPFQVTTGTLRGFRLVRDGPQAIGATAHDALTDWGHSGSPLFDTSGHIVALHNSWNSATDMRHAVSWEAMRAFLGE